MELGAASEGEAMTADTPVFIASVSKSITAMGIDAAGRGGTG